MGGVARENGLKALSIGGTENHVHLLLSVPPTMALSKAMQLIKGCSSKWINETYPSHNGFAWQEGYGAFSISVSGIEQTKSYIEKQRERHRAMTFEEDYEGFLRRHGIEYDERYIWG